MVVTVNNTQFNFRLSDGTVIPAGINPKQAATVDVAPVLTGQIASPVPQSILTMERELQKAGVEAKKFDPATSITPVGKDSTQESQEEGAVDTSTPDFAQFGEFTRQLQFGSQGEDVKRLQQFLNSQGFTVAPEGQSGGKGSESEFFGPKTQAALQKYQKTQGIVSKGDAQTTGFGRLGPQTLKSINTFTAPPAPDVPDNDIEGVGGGTELTEDITPDISQTIKDTQTDEDVDLETLLTGSTLSDDEKEILKSIFSATSSFDKDLLQRLEAGFDAAEKLGEPFFNAQIRLAKDELQRGFVKLEDDLEFKEKSLTKTLSQLREDVGLAKSRGSIEEQSQLSQLEKALGLKLEDTRQNLATSGFTSSSRRARSEELLRETTGELRESTQRGFAQKREDLSTSLTRGETATAEEIKRLQGLTKTGKLDLGRKTEKLLGSKEVGGLGFEPLGDIAGTLQADRQKDLRSFASSFVF